MLAPRPPASASSARAAPRTRSWCCLTPTSNRPPEIVADSAFGCAGQRCLASSLAITVGEAAAAVCRGDRGQGQRTRVTGYGLDDGVQMGPVISPESARASKR